MAPTDKARAAGVSSTSFLDLKAQVTTREDHAKAAGRPAPIVIAKRQKDKDKKISHWAKQNSGVQARSARDVELEAVSRPTLESAYAILERKAKVYEKLSKGQSGGLTEAQQEALLVDFDEKTLGNFEPDSDDVDESLEVPKPPQNEEDDPLVEYQDEFGRTRTGRRSEIPRHLLQTEQEEPEQDDDPYVIHNPVGHFPVYEPTDERRAEIAAQLAADSARPLNVHYDASAEVRAKGAGFYQFASDAEARAAQMAELRAAREETERARAAAGAVDMRPGAEGLRAGEEDDATPERSRAMEKRKREVEDRRRLVEEKRRRIGGAGVSGASATPSAGSGATAASPRAEPAPLPGAATTKVQARPAVSGPSGASRDPFAMLEAQSAKSKAKGKAKEVPTSSPDLDAADKFLQELAHDILQRAKP